MGTGARSASSPSVRSTPSRLRISLSDPRAVVAIVARTSAATEGSLRTAYRAPSAWAITTDSEWATTSCISRAMRVRSSCAARRTS